MRLYVLHMLQDNKQHYLTEMFLAHETDRAAGLDAEASLRENLGLFSTAILARGDIVIDRWECTGDAESGWRLERL